MFTDSMLAQGITTEVVRPEDRPVDMDKPTFIPKVKVSKTLVDGDSIQYVVQDTGIGVPADQAENIFKEFFQLDEYSDGTGIGLSIARQLARHMGGDITLDTTYTAGARFIVTLPNIK